MPHPDAALRLVWAAERAKTVGAAAEIAGLNWEYGLPREAVPTEWPKVLVVWKALLEEMPMTALIHTLATLTRIGLRLDNQRPDRRHSGPDPDDAERLDCVGFSTATPTLMSNVAVA